MALACTVVLQSNDATARAPRPPDPAPVISVITFGPGAHPFAKFGHNAIRVQMKRRGREPTDRVYNFGTFRFDSPWLIVDFLQGRFKYWLSTGYYRSTVADYRRNGRSVRVQQLALTDEQSRQLAAELAQNAKPENREYLYDYYRDNCSTRVRDALDRALGGALHEQMQAQTWRTYRGHTLRLTADSLLLMLGLDVALNGLTDAPLTEWQEAFLPGRLADSLRRIKITRSGTAVPLVVKEEMVYEPPAAPLTPVPRAHWFGLWGLLVGGTLFGLGRLGRREAGLGRSLFWGALATTALFGVLGVLFLVLWTTDHDVGQANANLLLFSPLALATPLLGFFAAKQHRFAKTALRVLVDLCALGALVATFAAVTGVTSQDNVRFIFLMVPLWVGAALGVRAAFSPRVAPAPTAEPVADATTVS